MQWKNIKKQYHNEWLIIDAIDAKSRAKKRLISEVEVLGKSLDSFDAYKKYKRLHKAHPEKEIYVVYSNWEKLNFEEAMRPNIRGRI